MTARRRGGIPPIVTVLITISAVVAAGIVAYFLFSTTSSATKQPMLEVTGAYAVGTTLTFTIRNVGTQNVQISSLAFISCVNPDAPTTPINQASGTNPSCSGPVQPGQSLSCRVTMASSLKDGASCTATINTNSGTLDVGFKVIVP